MSGRLDHLRALLRLVVRGARARGGPGPEPGGPRRKAAVERSGVTADPRRVARYLAATGGSRIAAFAGDGAILPPLFPATWETAACLELFASLEPPLPLGGIIHQEEETTLLRPLRADEPFRCRVELERVERTRRGHRLTVVARNWTSAGILCSQSTLVFLVRTRGGGDAPSERPTRGGHSGDDTPEHPGPDGERHLRIEPGWRDLDRWKLSGGAGRRYARASGDFNPIHLWGFTARPFGFARPILHGYCIEARVAHALVEKLWSGDPRALRRLRIAFRAPLPLPSTVLLRVAEGSEGRFQVAADSGEVVFAEGSFAGGR